MNSEAKNDLTITGNSKFDHRGKQILHIQNLCYSLQPEEVPLPSPSKLDDSWLDIPRDDIH